MLQLMIDVLAGAAEPARGRVEFVLTPLGWQWIDADTKKPLLHTDSPIFDSPPAPAAGTPEWGPCKNPLSG